MSGLEVAGLVLAVLPIFLAVLDAPIILRTLAAFRKRAYVAKLARALLLQKQTIAENIKSIASLSGCDNVWLVDDDPFTYLLSKQVQEQIRDYLGEDNHAALSGVMTDSHDTLERIAGSIEGLLPGGKGASRNLRDIISTNRDAKGKPDIRSRVKVLFKGQDLITAVNDLDNTTAQIDRFTRVLVSNQHSATNTPSRKARKLARALRRIRDLAGDIPIALGRGFTLGCHVQHEVNLFLEDRLSTAAGIFDHGRKRSQSDPLMDFRLVIAMQRPAGLLWAYETAVHVYREENEESKDPRHPESPRPGPHETPAIQVTFEASLTPSQTPPDVLPIENICGALEAPSRFGVRQGACFVLTRQQRIGVSCRGNAVTTLFTKVSGNKIALSALLSASHKTPLKFRMQLALRLASNLLQLFQTQWLQRPWSKHEVYFPIRPPLQAAATQGLTSPAHEAPEFNRPFISLTFENNGRLVPPHPGVIDAKAALLELGILLLELWHQSPFEARPGATGGGGYYQRLAAALEWLDDTAVVDPMPELYDRAASLCIRGVIGGQAKLADWEDMGFWAGVCVDVIEPLEKGCRVWQRVSGGEVG
ncbi:predicted protein [Chaetomium globosum CBS 148.51]|uniref:DUF7580 domain-containing protein n=1 Tax=Chaetomium globosum (strain ATCC 6205 / CBS 148.51 / DSM 1962 / NBRC 6347 / NRRL 1970) TaxID=306901 RepID=Q2HES1_CHAGB|nr:uncharacterized protein CHGG_01283 [Chaetomium globosum CBS 148.51]EAQ93048.1 predicted protein [Chaetomium globosum CBS 148.51]